MTRKRTNRAHTFTHPYIRYNDNITLSKIGSVWVVWVKEKSGAINKKSCGSITNACGYILEQGMGDCKTIYEIRDLLRETKELLAEWVMDSYAPDYYQQAPYRDPPGPKDEDENKVIRGGSWRESRIGARVTKRFAAKMWRNDASVGFRCAKDPPTENPQSS